MANKTCARPIVFALLLASSGAAHAGQTFDLVAIYNATSGGPQKTVTISDGAILPVSTADYRLDSFAIQFHAGALRKGDVFGLDQFTFGRSLAGVSDTAHVSWLNRSAAPSDAVAGNQIALFSYDPNRGPGQVDNLAIDVRARYLAPYLCAQERALRESADASKAFSDLDTKYKNALQTILKQHPVPPGQRFAVTKFGTPILYSFCDPDRFNVDWAAAAKQTAKTPELRLALSKAPGTEPNPDELLEEHKGQLSDLLSPMLPTLGMGVDPGLVSVAAGSHHTNLALVSVIRFSVIKDMGALFEFVELDGSHPRTVSTIVDQQSKLLLQTQDSEHSTAVCDAIGGCDHLFNMGIEVAFETIDSKGNTIPKVLDLAQKNSRRYEMKIALTDQLDKTGHIKVSMTLNDQKTVIAQSVDFTVKNLGLVTTFPGVSEIAALVNKYNSNDQESQSSIPVSWAINFSKRTVGNVAITLPWMLSWNTRNAPDLAKYFSIFFHISLLIAQSPPAGTAPTFQFAAGAGISVAQVFQLSWAVTHTADQYLLLGLNIPGLCKLKW